MKNSIPVLSRKACLRVLQSLLLSCCIVFSSGKAFGQTFDIKDWFILLPDSEWHYTGDPQRGSGPDDNFARDVQGEKSLGARKRARRIEKIMPGDPSNGYENFWYIDPGDPEGKLFLYGFHIETNTGALPAQDVVFEDPILLGHDDQPLPHTVTDTGKTWVKILVLPFGQQNVYATLNSTITYLELIPQVQTPLGTANNLLRVIVQIDAEAELDGVPVNYPGLVSGEWWLKEGIGMILQDQDVSLEGEKIQAIDSGMVGGVPIVADGLDCNENNVADHSDISTGASPDCNSNEIPDECDIAGGMADVNGNDVPDVCEEDNCPNDPNKLEPGICGCGFPDVGDWDGDGTLDCVDDCPYDPDKVEPGVCGCGTPDTDTDSDGVPDCIDNCPDEPNAGQANADGDDYGDACDDCPSDPNKADPGQCGCGTPDTDSDLDGTPDCFDNCPLNNIKTEPGICGCGAPDIDTDDDDWLDCQDNCPDEPNSDQANADGDPLGDACDGCPSDPNKTAPGECGCGEADTDSDLDGTPDCLDGCPFDRDKGEPGQCGCGVPDTDTDEDGTADCNDDCPSDPNKTEPGECGCDEADTDTDGDGTPDCHDNCPDDPNGDQADSDGDGVGNVCDNCPDDPNGDQANADGDQLGDSCDGCPDDPDKTEAGECGCGEADTDTDGDGTPDCHDNCPDDPNADQVDSDGDGVGNVCDNCPDDPNADQWNTDADQAGNACDECPSDPDKTEAGECGCGEADTDTDGDGIPDCHDNCPDVPIEKGDVNNDCEVGLKDAILSLQMLTPMSPAADVYMEADVNSDGEIGIEEPIYILQKVSTVR